MIGKRKGIGRVEVIGAHIIPRANVGFKIELQLMVSGRKIGGTAKESRVEKICESDKVRLVFTSSLDVFAALLDAFRPH